MKNTLENKKRTHSPQSHNLRNGSYLHNLISECLKEKKTKEIKHETHALTIRKL